MHEKMSAPVVKRFAALIIDLIILNIFVLGPFSGVFAGISSMDSATQLLESPESRATITGALIMISIITMLYYAVLQSKFGQTIGMMIMKIYTGVILGRKQTRYPTIMEAVLRNLFVVPIAPFLFLWIIEPITMFVDKRGRRLMEIVSKTQTLSEESMVRGGLRG
jgi:uncharacterized RDD family membrane protein YckC